MTLAAPDLKTSYAQRTRLLKRRYERSLVALSLAILIAMPLGLTSYEIHLVNQALLACLGALALHLLTGMCGQISLGNAAFLAVGGFTTVAMQQHLGAPFWLVVPVAGVAGGLLGVVVGIPSLRFRGIYLAISTLAMHYAIVFLAKTYQANLGQSISEGIPIADPALGAFTLSDDGEWYYVLLALAAGFVIFSMNATRSRLGRAWMAIRDRDVSAEAIGINLAHYKLLAFVISSALVTVVGSVTAYYTNVVTADEYNLELAVAYLAMIIIGGIGSVLGAIFGAVFITFLPFALDYVFDFLPLTWRIGTPLFGFQSGAVGLFILLFLVLEPRGLVELWRRLVTYFERWPFKYRPLDTGRG